MIEGDRARALVFCVGLGVGLVLGVSIFIGLLGLFRVW